MSDQWNKPKEPGDNDGEKKEENSSNSHPPAEGYTASEGAIREDEDHHDPLKEETSSQTPLSFAALKPEPGEEKPEEKKTQEEPKAASPPSPEEQKAPPPPPLPPPPIKSLQPPPFPGKRPGPGAQHPPQPPHQQPPRGAAPPPPPPPQQGWGPPPQQGPPPGYGQVPPGGGYRPPGPPPGWGGPPQGPRPRNRAIPLIIGLIIIAVVVGGGLIGLIGTASMSSGGSGGGFMGDRVAVLEINGVLGEGPRFEADTKRLINQVRAWERNPRIKAMVVRINSPGGAVSATQDLYHELQNFRDSGRPVVASLGDIAASGGYYAAIAADEIYANEGSLTGSIGVIMNFFNFEGLQETIGIHSRTIKSGKFKDIGSGSRAMTLEERELLGDMVDDVYEQFLEAVIAGREGAVRILLADTLGKDAADVSMAEIEEHLRKYSDGRIFSGRQAKEYSMIDSIGTMQQAIARARELAGLPANAGITTGPPRPTGLFGGLGAISNRLQTLPAMDELGSVRLEYRFAGF